MARQRLSEARQLDKPEALGEREVLVQQPVAAERTVRVRNQRLVAGEADRLDRLAPEPFEPWNGPYRRRHQDTEPAPENQLVELQRDVIARGEVDVEPVHQDLIEPDRCARAQLQLQHAADALAERQRVQRELRHRRRVSRLDDVDRPQRDIVGGTELTRRLLAARHLSPQHGAARDRESAGQRGLVHRGKELGDHHRRGRGEIMRIGDLQQVLGEPRELGVELQANSRAEEADAFEQSLGVRVRDLGGVERQPRGDLRKLPRELRPHLPHVRELLVVIPEHARVHQ